MSDSKYSALEAIIFREEGSSCRMYPNLPKRPLIDRAAINGLDPNLLFSQVAAFVETGHCQARFWNLRFVQQEIQNETDNCSRRGEQEVHGPVRVSISVTMRPRRSSGAFLFLDQRFSP